jgi:HEPN domain-containing protein
MEHLKQFVIFYRKAKTDLAMARLAQANPSDEIDNEAVLFHLQQAVEKFLKSLLSFHGVATEKTHDIEAIAKKGKASQIELPFYTEELYDLSEYAVEGRYGQIHDDIENIDIYFERIESLKCFVEESHNQSQGG